MNLKGGCLCRSIRYEASPPVLGQAVCHCRNCQKQSGSAFSVLVAVQRPALKIEPFPVFYEDTADSGQWVNRYFCNRCGSPIFSEVAGSPDVLYLKAGTLDDPNWLAPRVHVWCDSAWPWTTFSADAIKIAKNPS